MLKKQKTNERNILFIFFVMFFLSLEYLLFLCFFYAHLFVKTIIARLIDSQEKNKDL